MSMIILNVNIGLGT